MLAKLKLFGMLLVLPLLAVAAVNKVTVYPKGALISDLQTLQVKKGPNEISWGTIGKSVDINSITVDLPEGVRLLDKQVVRVQETNDVNEHLSELIDQREELFSERDNLADELSVLKKSQGYLDDIQRATTTPVEGEGLSTTQQWQQMMSFLQVQRTEALSQQRDLLTQQEQLRRQIDKINREISQLNMPSSLSRQELVIKIEALKPIAELPVTVKYFDYAARWQPSYQVDVDSSTGDVALTYSAEVAQGTIADWSNVELTLSTARPSMDATLPQLTPWWLTEKQVYAVRSRNLMAQKAMFAGAAAPMADDAMVMEEMEAAPTFASAQINSKLSFVEVTLPGTTSIKADQQQVELVVDQIDLSGELTYAAVPELSSEVFLQASVTNDSSLPLLAGAAKLFVDDNFVGRSMLKAVEPGEAFDLSLGLDRSVRVERKQLARKTDLTGFGNDKRRVTYVYKIKVENFKKAPIQLTLTERIPLSQHEKIKVSLEEPQKMQPDTEGKLVFNWMISAGQSKTQQVSYWVEYPKDMAVEGL